MLNRRHLRVKVFQAIYSYLGGAKNDLGIGEKELIKGIDRVHELFVFHLSIFSELQRFAAKRLEERKTKRLPTPKDLNPNMSFVNNELLTALAESEDLQKKIESYKISWVLNDDIIKKLYRKIEESNTFGKYMAAENHDAESQKQFVLKLYREFIADDEVFQDLFEETSIHWNDDHYFVCGYVVKFLKSFQSKHKENLAVPRLFKDKEDDVAFIQTLYRQTLVNNDEYQKIIMEKAKNWEADRIAVVDFILMKMAVCELIKLKSVPIKVTLNEYIELSKSYSTPKSKLFINGVLDKIVPELKASGDIQKTGRGLMN